MAEWWAAGADPFAGLSWWVIAGVAAAHFLGCFIRGAFGFGSNMPIVIITTFLLGPHHAILLALMTTIIAQASMIPQGIRDADWGVMKPLVLGIILGTAFGTWLFTVLAPDTLVVALGFLIACVVIMDTVRVVDRLTRHVDLRARSMTATFSFIGGALGGLSGAGAFYFLVIYLKHACETPAALRSTNLLLSALTMVTRVVSLVIAGMITLTVVTEGLLLMPVVLAATWAGTHAFRHSTPRGFYIALQALLLVGATALIVKGISRL